MLVTRFVATMIVVALSTSLTACISKKTVVSPIQGRTQINAPADANSKNWVYSSVIRIIDGDTIEVLIGQTKEKVRLLGINAPESVDPQRPMECFGIQASQQMHLLLTGKKIYLAADKFATDRDQYGRLLRYVYDEYKQMINLELIKNGYAFAYTPGRLEHFSELRYYEKQARDEGRGLWNSAVCPYKSKYGQ